MPIKTNIQILSILFVFTLFSMSCKKIDIPNEEAKEIFGEWKYLGNTGGFSGEGGSTRFPENCWVKFSRTGHFNVYENAKLISTTPFMLTMKESIYSSKYRPAIVTKKGNHETFEIHDDKLYLSDEAHDGYTYYFERK